MQIKHQQSIRKIWICLSKAMSARYDWLKSHSINMIYKNDLNVSFLVLILSCKDLVFQFSAVLAQAQMMIAKILRYLYCIAYHTYINYGLSWKNSLYLWKNSLYLWSWIHISLNLWRWIAVYINPTWHRAFPTPILNQYEASIRSRLPQQRDKRRKGLFMTYLLL